MARFEKEQLVLGKAYSHDLGAEVQCANCKKTEHVKDILCRCDRPYHFTAKRDANGKLGLSCNNCKTGSGVWTCAKCSKNNDMDKTFGRQKAGYCFVATAAFGAADAPEVVYLSDFRDEILSRSVFGRKFISFYYAISPFFASIIAQSVFLRSAVRRVFLKPMIGLLRIVFDSDEKN
jgi:hypothetical protein